MVVVGGRSAWLQVKRGHLPAPTPSRSGNVFISGKSMFSFRPLLLLKRASLLVVLCYRLSLGIPRGFAYNGDCTSHGLVCI